MYIWIYLYSIIPYLPNMKLILRKILHQLTTNSRISTKDLAKHTHSSQQAISYTLKQFSKRKEIIDYYSVIDTAMLGYTHVYVCLYLSDFSKQKEILKELNQMPSVVSLDEGSQGIDILAEYSVKNLSQFNKEHTAFMKKFRGFVNSKFIFPIVVRRLYPHNYLSKSKEYSDIIILGDREIVHLSDNEQKVLKAFSVDARDSYTSIAKKTDMSIKTVIAIKRELQRKKIIQQFTAFLDHKKLDIKRSFIFIRLGASSIGEMNKFVQFAMNNHNIIQLDKIIGYYDVVVTVEAALFETVLRDIREHFSAQEYVVMPVAKRHKKRLLVENYGE